MLEHCRYNGTIAVAQARCVEIRPIGGSSLPRILPPRSGILCAETQGTQAKKKKN
jgi:hypothetical protein